MANFPDPYHFLQPYIADYPSWSDPAYDVKLGEATANTDSAVRMKELAECEATLLRAMPIIPLYFDTWVYLERPELHGLHLNPLGVPSFKFAWLEQHGSLQ